MTNQRVAWDGYLSLTVPPGWEWGDDDGTISIYDPCGAGVVQISFASSHAQPSVIDVDGLTQSFAEAQGLEDIRPERILLDGVPGSYFEGITKGAEPALWRAWTVSRKGRIATISYTCNEEDLDLERPQVDELIRSIRWLF